MAMFASMQNKRPEDVTGDDVNHVPLIARVHSFLCALLSFLGFRVLPVESVVDMLGTLETWLVDAKKVRDDRRGVTSKLWWDAFKEAWKVKDTIGAGVAADFAIAEFGKRFVPIVAEDENDRDTDTGDLDAMRAELDAADRYRSEICNALDGIEGNRAFVHGKVIDELRAERDALLKANAHHASEVEQLRRNWVEYVSLVCQALGVDHETDTIATITAMRNKLGCAIGERDSAQKLVGVHKTEIERLYRLRTIGGDGHVDERSFWTTVVSGWEQCTGCSLPSDARGLISRLTSERDVLKAQLAGAVVPQPKPEKIEPGQKWAYVATILKRQRVGFGSLYVEHAKFVEKEPHPAASGGVECVALEDYASWLYLGTDKV